MKNVSVILVVSVAAILAPRFALGGDIDAGKAKSTTCAACHGKNGIASIPMYPNLAGQNEQYILSSLKAYKNKDRKGGQAAVMYGQAAALSEEDMKNLAAYYSSLK